MPLTIHPILTITPVLPATQLLELQKILCTIAHGAFDGQSDCQIVLADNVNHAVLMIEHTFDAEPRFTQDVAIRLASTMIQLLGLLARELGVSARKTTYPHCPMLSLTGLTWHRVRLSLVRLVAMLQSTTYVELACPKTGLHLRIGTGKPLGHSAPIPFYMCDAVVRRRLTSRGEVVRIRCGQRLMSIAIPRNVSGSVISDGSLISTTPVVGLIARRMCHVSPCQFRLFECDIDQSSRETGTNSLPI